MKKNVNDRNQIQPGGWSASVKPLLSAENVELIADNQVKITLPKCEDYDIDEDETISVVIPAESLVKSTVPIDAGTFTIRADTFEERIDNALKALHEEKKGLSQSTAVPSFMFTFFTCEIVAKSLISLCKYKNTPRKTPTQKWSVNKITSALSELDISINENILNYIFEENKRVVASKMSARALRNCVAHKMKSVHRNAIKIRYTELMSNMDIFLNEIEEWRKKNNHNIPDYSLRNDDT